jgi:Tfp pilus assembly protein PilN
MIGVNLIPVTMQLRQTLRQRLWGWALCNAAVGVAVVLPSALEWFNRAQADELRSRSLEVQEALSTAQAELRAVRDEADGLHLQLQRADALRSKRAWSGLLGLIAKNLPEGSWLTRLATDPASPHGASRGRPARAGPSGPQPDRPEVVTIEAPRKLRLVGFASTAGEPLTLVTNLKQTEVFSRVALEQSQLDRAHERAVFRFEVVCEW